MRKRSFAIIIFVFPWISVNAQENTTFKSISAVPESYNASTVTARLVESLGFRYYWATEGLRTEDLEFTPSQSSRSSKETIEHIYYLVSIIYNAHFHYENSGISIEGKSFTNLRHETLTMLEAIRNFLIETNPDPEKLSIKTPQGEIPYWNLLNGPLADAIYHTGQVVAFRRMSGNPIRDGVDVFMGIVRE